MASISPIPASVVAQIKSSITVTSLNGVVLELLKNSIDASSSQVEIHVDYRRGNCTVDDDGDGISPVDFREGGCLGKFHCKTALSLLWTALLLMTAKALRNTILLLLPTEFVAHFLLLCLPCLCSPLILATTFITLRTASPSTGPK
jgi:hypothetical protein